MAKEKSNEISFEKVEKIFNNFDEEVRDGILCIGEDYANDILKDKNLTETEREAVLGYILRKSTDMANAIKVKKDGKTIEYVADPDVKIIEDPVKTSPRESVSESILTMPYNVFDINLCITIANIYRMCRRPALICGKVGTGFTVFTSGLTWEAIQDSKKNEMFDLVMYTDGFRITTIMCPDDNERYYLL